MASLPGSSKPKKRLRNLLRETLHVGSRSKSPSQPSDKSQQQDLGQSAGPIINPEVGPSLVAYDATGTDTPVAKLDPRAVSGVGTSSAKANVAQPAPRQNAIWVRLRRSLEELKDSPNLISLLSPAIEALLSCLDKLEDAARNRPDYEELAEKLAASSDLLVQIVREHGSIPPSDATLSLIIIARIGVDVDGSAIQELTPNAKEELEHRIGLGVKGVGVVGVDFASYCWRLRLLFDQLQHGLLDRLEPIQQTTYISSLAMDPLRRSCSEGTRTGVLTSIDEWLDDTEAASICRVTGTAGTGKTTIAHTFCNRVDNRKRLAASLFVNHGAEFDAIRVLKTVAYQLAQYSAPFQRALCNVFPDDLGITPYEPLGVFQSLIKQPLEATRDVMPEGTVVVIDGLDKCEDGGVRKAIIDILLQSRGELHLRFLVTTRDRVEGLEGGSTVAIHLDDIDRSLVRSDISLYLGTELGSMSLTDAQLEQLIDRTDALFLCATLLVRFISLDRPGSNSHERLNLILTMTLESTKKHAYIDALYTAILSSILGQDDTMEGARVVLWTVLYAQEAIGVETIAIMTGIDNMEQVRSALQPLRPVLHYSEESGLVSTLHKSFPEFMLNTEKSGVYFYDLAKHSRTIAERCFNAMKAGLRFNICELQSSFVPDQNVPDLQARIKDKISPTLLYACRYWANHLELAAVYDRLIEALEDFLSNRLLFWMEVLSLKRDMRTGVMELMKANRWMKAVGTGFSELGVFVEDAYDFVTSYAANPVSLSTPHIYISALPFCPRSSRVYHSYSKRTTGLLSVSGRMMEYRETDALAVWQPDACSVAYSPNGDHIGYGDREGSAGILDAYDGTQLFELSHSQISSRAVSSVAFSPDGLKFATGSHDCTVRVWSTADGTPISDPFEGHAGGVTSLAFSPDNMFIASGSLDGTVRIWRVNDGTTVIGPLEGCGGFAAPVAFSPSGSHLATSSVGESVLLWNIRTSPPSATKLKGHTSSVRSVAFSPDGLKLVSGSFDSTIRVWNTSDGRCERQIIGHALCVVSLAISPNGCRIVSASNDETMRVWDLDSGSLVAGPFYPRRAFEEVAYSPDGTRVVSCYSFRVWSVRDGAFLPTLLPAKRFDTTSIALSPSGMCIYATSPTGGYIWDTSDGSLISSFPGTHQPACSMPVSPDGACVAVFLDDHSVEVLSTNDGTSIAGPFHGHTGSITSVAFSSDATYLATGSEDCTVQVWSLRDGRPAGGPFVGHTGTITLVFLSSDGSRLISSSTIDRSIRLWHTRGSAICVSVQSQDGLCPSLSLDDYLGVAQFLTVQDDGWVTNADGLLLYWIPINLVSKPNPHIQLIINSHGALILPTQNLFMGREWARCFVGGVIS